MDAVTAVGGTNDGAAGAPPEVRALLVEDDPDDVFLCERAMRSVGTLQCTIEVVGSLREALDALDVARFDVAVVDLSLPDSSGIATVSTLAERHPEVPIVVLTGLVDDEAALAALHAGAQDYLVKGRVDAEATGRAIRYAIERGRIDSSRRAQETAERANLAKSRFLSRMSHELRTPLNSILGFGQILEMTVDGEDREYVEQILRGGRHLLGLIEEVIDIARIEAGEIAISVEPVGVDEVAVECLQMIAPIATQHGVAVSAESPTADPPSSVMVMADRQRLKQVLINLLSNAVKYNRRGGSVAVSWSAPVEGRVRVEVRDSGIGLAPEQASLAFTPFERLGAEDTAVEGTGLGLALTKSLVETMGGEIGLVSEQGTGTTVWTVWDAADPAHAVLDLAAVERPGGDVDHGPAATVVYMVGNPANLRLVEGVFERRPGVRVFGAPDARTGLDLVAREHPDVVLLDLNLPDLPGAEVLRRLRESPESADVPVVVVTADASKGLRDALLDVGAQAFLTKPIDVVELLGVVDSILARRP